MKYNLRSLIAGSLWAGSVVSCLAMVVLFLIPVSRETASFTSVNSLDEYKDSVSGYFLPGKPNGDFIVHENKLYLKVQGVRSAMVLVTFVRRYQWSTEKLVEFRNNHPELEPYFPDGTKPNAGIAWIPLPTSQAPAPIPPKH